MKEIERAIMHAAEAGKLRSYVRKNGNAGSPNGGAQNGWTGLAGLVRLADRHSALANAALKRTAAESAR